MGVIAEALDTVREAAAGVRKSAGAVGAAIPFVTPGTAAFPNFNYETLAREGYSKNEIVFACIDEWATDIAEPRICGYRQDERIEDHDLVRLLNRPNPFLSGSDLASTLQLHKRIAGNAFIEKVRSGAGKVVELWTLRPDRIQIIPDPVNFIAGYRYRIGRIEHIFAPEDIIHLKTRHPLDDFYGMPPLMAAAGRVDIDNFMRDVVKTYLNNIGIPAGVLTIAGAALDDEEKKRLKRRFRDEYGGRNAGNVIVADGATTASFTPMGMPLGARGLVIPDLDEIDESRIGMVFRVPLSLVGSRLGAASSSYANRKSDREFFTEQQLVPEWASMSSALTHGLVNDFVGLDRVEYDTATVRALQEDQDALHTRLRADLAAAGCTLEEFRRDTGREEQMSPDETLMLPMGLTPIRVSVMMEEAAAAAQEAPPVPSDNPSLPYP